jgi:trehalose 6-phosphate phosphatase
MICVDAQDVQSTVDAFFVRVATALERTLVLDYDGTLTPSDTDHTHRGPYPGVRDLLRALVAVNHTRVIIISARSVKDLMGVLGMDEPPELWGSHGLERRWPDGRVITAPLSAIAREGLLAAAQAAAERGLGHALQQTPTGLALHWRGLSARGFYVLREEIGEAWTSIVLRYGLRVEPLDGCLELRPGIHNKGTAAQELLNELGPRSALAYLGDDLTDEDAFHSIGNRGLKVIVRREHRPSTADVWLRPPEDLLAFLERWATMTAGPRL